MGTQRGADPCVELCHISWLSQGTPHSLAWGLLSFYHLRTGEFQLRLELKIQAWIHIAVKLGNLLSFSEPVSCLCVENDISLTGLSPG